MSLFFKTSTADLYNVSRLLLCLQLLLDQLPNNNTEFFKGGGVGSYQLSSPSQVELGLWHYPGVTQWVHYLSWSIIEELAL